MGEDKGRNMKLVCLRKRMWGAVDNIKKSGEETLEPDRDVN
jgi:hypothetical protein